MHFWMTVVWSIEYRIRGQVVRRRIVSCGPRLAARSDRGSAMATNENRALGGVGRRGWWRRWRQAGRYGRAVPATRARHSRGRLGHAPLAMSREHFPKQLIGVVGPDSLLQATVSRMKGFPGDWTVAAEPIIVCGEEHRFDHRGAGPRERRERTSSVRRAGPA